MTQSATTTANRFEHIRNNMFNHALILTQDSRQAKRLLQATLTEAQNHSDESPLMPASFKNWVIGMMKGIYNREFATATAKTSEQTRTYAIGITVELEAPESSIEITRVDNFIRNCAEPVRTAYGMYLKGYRNAEIALTLGISERAVKAVIAKGASMVASI